MKSDSKIQADVMEELQWDPSIAHQAIGVSVKDGIVTLSGNVPTYAEKTRAEKAALRVAGVAAVVEHLVVKPSSSYERDDSDIARAAADNLSWNSLIPKQIKVTVNEGVVTLSGEVQWNYQRETANSAVKNLMGVRQVKNLIKINTAQPSKDLGERIREAIHRAQHAPFGEVQVDVDGFTVTLRGKVKTFAEREAAEAAAWSAAGVKQVKDNIKIDHAGFL